jgi:hypothetical protein
MGIYSAHYAHHPPGLEAVHVALVADVTNAADVRAKIVRAATLDDQARDEVNFAFVDARLVCHYSRFILTPPRLTEHLR